MLEIPLLPRGVESNLRTIPHSLGVLAVLLDDRENACRHNPVCAAKIVVDFYVLVSLVLRVNSGSEELTLEGQCYGLLQLLKLLGEGQIPLGGGGSARHD